MSNNCADAEGRRGYAVVIDGDSMGRGDEQLGHILIKGFLYAIRGVERLPDTVIMYNSGAKLALEGSEALEDLRVLENAGVEIITCGTCLDFYNAKDRLAVGKVTNMYTICQKLSECSKIIKP